MTFLIHVYLPYQCYVSAGISTAPSCLDKIDCLNNTNSNNNKVEPTLESLSEHFALNEEDILHPTSFKTIMRC